MPSAAPFALLTDMLCALIARHGLARRLAGPLIVLIWGRVRKAGTLTESLLARLRAGQLRRYPTRRTPRTAAAPRRRPAQSALPRRRGWLIHLIPETAGSAAQLQTLLTGPDIPALLQAAPQLRRTLRPLCHMLGVTLPRPPAAPEAERPAIPPPPAAAYWPNLPPALSAAPPARTPPNGTGPPLRAA